MEYYVFCTGNSFKWNNFIVYACFRLSIWDLLLLAVKSVHVLRDTGMAFSSFFLK